VIKVLHSGERVIVDPVVTVSRLFMYFYLIINVGSLTGGISMVYAEKYIGFWCAFALPTVMFLLCPIVLSSCSDRYHQTAPSGSVLGSAFRLYVLAWRQRLSGNTKKAGFWDAVKPSNIKHQPSWMNFSDSWVDQVARGFSACRVFAWFPLYWLAYNQMVNNLTSQSATLDLGRVPNDIVNNLNPLCLILVIPLMDNFIYPLLRRFRVNFTPIKRITLGFFIASLAITSAAITQRYIYNLSACGTSAGTCDTPAPISVWVQTIPYVLIGMSEVFASVTGLEYAFTKAPENMRSLVTGVFLMQTAFSSILGQLLVPLSADPYLVLNYSLVAFLAAAGGIGFWFSHRELDKREDELNMLDVQAE
jgi:POT family proton-dependent oligopeptide transporter